MIDTDKTKKELLDELAQLRQSVQELEQREAQYQQREQIAQQLLQDAAAEITARQQAEQRRDIQYAIAQVLAEATTVSEALPAILQGLCENLGWQLGIFWSVNRQALHSTQSLHYGESWRSPTVSAQALIESSLKISFVPGAGLPGRVWANRQPLWLSNLSQDSNFSRATAAAQAGLQAVFGFPILLGSQVLGIIECFGDRIQEPDPDLLNMMAAIGSQIGQFMERKRTEASLKESHELFQSFMNHSPIAAFIKDEAGRYIYANPWVERVLQRSQSELLDKTDFELLPPATAEQCRENDVAVLTGHQPIQTLETIPHADGEHSYMAFKFPFWNAAGQQLVAGVAIDVSERIQAEVALQQRENELRLITNTLPVLISFIDTEQRYRFINQTYEQWFGRAASEVCGKHLWEVLGATAYATVRPYIEQVLAGQSVSFETEMRYHDIPPKVISGTFVPRFDSQGKVEGFVALVSDITRRKQAEETLRQSEERLRIAQQAANAGVWDWNITTNQVSWSAEYYCLYGLDPAITQPSYENWISSILEQDRDRVDRLVRETLAHQLDLNVEFRILHPIQGERWLTAIGQTFYNENKQPIRMTGIALDITERKQAEQALQESEEWARLAIQVARLGGWRLHLHTNLVEMDSRMCEIWGELEEGVTLPLPKVLERIHPDDRARVANAVSAAINPQASGMYEIEYRIIWNDGTERWVLAKGQAQFEGEGTSRRTVDFFGTLLDITERKQVEAALARSNQTLQATIQACPQAIVGLRSDGTVQIWNPAAERIFGWKQQEVLGQFLPTIPDHQQEQFLKDLAATSKGQCLAGLETQRQKKGDVLFDVELWTAPVDEAQAGISCVTVVADITARKRTEAALRLSEERLRSFVSANVIGILFGDLEGGIQEANDEFLRIVGYTREDLQSGNLRWVDITPPEYLPLDEQAIVEARHRGACTPYEKEYIRKDGRRIPVFVGFSLTYAMREEAVAFILDLTERKQLLQREQIAREQAEAANRVKDEFLAVLSHELRTPLNPILGWTKLLRTREFDAAAIDRALETIERNAKLQAQLIEDLLDVSRILQGKVQLDAHPVNLITIIKAALETVQLSAEAKGIQIQTEFKLAGEKVNGDANRLQQIIWNLLSNAIKFTPSEGQVKVKLENVNGYSQIQVSDTGQGISAEFLPHVFEYFRQADSTTTRQFGGLGLGLAIVHYLVNLHGGTVTAESPGSGMGATFTVQLPLAESESAPELEIPPPQENNHLNGISILVVDDEPDMRNLIGFILQEQGATVRVAASAAEALQQIAKAMPDILISDIGMPEMDGYALMRQIQSAVSEQSKLTLTTPPATPVGIALTAYAGEINQREALSAGFQLHLAKPIEPDQLVKAIAQLETQSHQSSE